ncbi:Glutathione S-transferase theta-1, variant 2 [Stylosanthes scabra]|uniref:Glutathione S-transferase theta-1, variant 2 n=1 Tax=Stylosanthes scabra TaxID=79078 RepID=A0ABU6RS50_9FABA|nr:Glutathione S-transferase theta-1, variant 2 [Stylosanthes scabra]
MGKLKVYADRMSQPSRAVLIFCRISGIDFEEIKVDISKGQHLSPDFTEVNPLQKVPAIVHGSLKLFESHAILVYLASAFTGIADHWYPTELSRRAKINSVMDWHHSNLRNGAVNYVINTTLAPALGRQLNPKAATEAENVLLSSLKTLEDIWLNGDGGFLCNGIQPSLADLSMVCELMQLEVLDERDRSRILSPYKKVLQWIENTRTATNPHFEEVHNILYRAKKKFEQQRARTAETRTGPSNKPG